MSKNGTLTVLVLIERSVRLAAWAKRLGASATAAKCLNEVNWRDDLGVDEDTVNWAAVATAIRGGYVS